LIFVNKTIAELKISHSFEKSVKKITFQSAGIMIKCILKVGKKQDLNFD